MSIDIIHGDCRAAVEFMPSNSIHSVVTDPPYALVSIQKRFGKPGSAPAKDVYHRGAAGFMGKQWDTGETAFDPAFWAEVWRVLRPGGHVLAFGGTRTYHRLACAIEDAGFEIRDQIGWAYGSGFPKSHNAALAIDKAKGAVGHLAKSFNMKGGGDRADEFSENGRDLSIRHKAITEEAAEWEGWGTALKPAWEPIVVARKPLDGTVAENLLRWGVGALNIDGCRVEGKPWQAHRATGLGSVKFFTEGDTPIIDKAPHDLGRWPANVIHDGSEDVMAAFPSNGSAARFFYCAKASRADRNDGLEGFTARNDPAHRRTNIETTGENPYLRGATERKNTHPTVKPTPLMRYLCRLVTPPGGVVLDPFMGSGSTGRGAVLEGFDFIGCELDADYTAIARARIAAVQKTAPIPDKITDGVFA